ncbi:MAG: hypothetical protein Q7S58_12345 [Candidatus Binatus sp.]|uniref:hypothetical protein n=1 Tax=Candidatus Binatus sp. TaxID=2811406 RepID=UPI00271CDC85|nr:hypothetical protein [Candidatus Binatus sp.]MDO8433190.1 hypothetical protein [Candidatus Binatus sp.]
MEAKPDPWNTHEWYNRRLEIQPGKPQMQRYCIRCGRNFVDDLWCDERYAAHAAIFHFERLADEVTARWLIEPCPGTHLPSDDDDRKLLNDASRIEQSVNGSRSISAERPSSVTPISALRRRSG